MGEVFSFVDASHLVAKVNIWQKRDKSIEKKKKLLNNKTLPIYPCFLSYFLNLTNILAKIR